MTSFLVIRYLISHFPLLATSIFGQQREILSSSSHYWKRNRSPSTRTSNKNPIQGNFKPLTASKNSVRTHPVQSVLIKVVHEAVRRQYISQGWLFPRRRPQTSPSLGKRVSLILHLVEPPNALTYSRRFRKLPQRFRSFELDYMCSTSVGRWWKNMGMCNVVF